MFVRAGCFYGVKVSKMRRCFAMCVVSLLPTASYEFEHECRDDRPLVCARRERCHHFLTMAATMCEGVDEYRAFCEAAVERDDVHRVVKSVESRFESCL